MTNKKNIMTDKELQEKNNINRKAKMVQDICKKDNGEYDDFSIYKNYVITLFAFGVSHKYSKQTDYFGYKHFIKIRFMKYCLDYRKLNKFYIIDDAIKKDFERQQEKKKKDLQNE